MKKSLVAALATATSATAVLLAGPATPATAASAFCDRTTPSTSILFYKTGSGEAGTGTLSAGRWQYEGALDLPAGYTHAAASRDSLLLYDKNTGDAEVGTFRDGQYNRTRTFEDFSTGWTFIEASGDSVIFYNGNSGHGVTGTLKNGAFRQVRAYDNFSTGWGTMAASCDTLVAAARHGSSAPWSNVGFGTLKNGVYRDTGSIPKDDYLGQLTATQDSVLSLAKTGGQLEFRVSDATDGSGIDFRKIGTSGIWDKVGRTSDSLFFYKNDGTAWTSTLVNGDYANVGPLPDVSSGWSLIEGGV
ncbi:MULTISPECIES: hypothetical protein [unclassified Streptomyces]|uniref:hypothetical protein n=1 Tax=unclassified Streptomyces TaxID=2593676 RepID=UPI00061EEC36|nr:MULTISPECIES: hypothetical protein [unclassified Streptomyces]KJY46163.1 hypothetical protein VR46_10680 [Streptomyces sp. NRRL S-444]KOY56066.1 hypothetical protein ADK59_21370 [Streptomyces sp. XY332]TDU74304.1 hypothetical protein EDD91_0943 [Streptomyces sp. KS 21]THA40197.1 hypothetical protein E6W17_07940 [Streptomyces sp. A1547]